MKGTSSHNNSKALDHNDITSKVIDDDTFTNKSIKDDTINNSNMHSCKIIEDTSRHSDSCTHNNNNTLF